MPSTAIREFFQSLPSKFDPEAAEGLMIVYQFELTGPEGGQYHLVVEDGRCAVQEGVHSDPHVTFSMTGEDCLGVLSGRLDGAAVFLSGRLRIGGDLGLALQLKTLFPTVG